MQVVEAGMTEMGMEIEMKMEMDRNKNSPKQPNSLVIAINISHCSLRFLSNLRLFNPLKWNVCQFGKPIHSP